MNMIRKTWKMLGRDIFVGERYEKNMRGIAIISLMVAMAGLVMFTVNMISGQYLVGLTSVAFMLTGVVVYFIVTVMHNRRAAMVVTIVGVLLFMTYNIVAVSNGFAFLWSILIPLTISYMFGARAGIIVSAYFSALFALLFYSPLRQLVAGSYPEIILNRFPILYFFLFVTTSYVMIQFQKSVLDQLDYAEQLEKAREAADRANKAKSDFLAEMSHEIRTPINAVLGMNEMIRRESGRGDAEESAEKREEAFRHIGEYAGNIEEAGTNLLSIINDILDFSKIEAGRMELVPGNYELNSLLSDASQAVAFRMREKGLEYTVDADGTIPNVLYGDKVRIRQILTNLLTNAYKYTRQGSVRLEVRAVGGPFRPGDTVTLRITVWDTGIGIREEDIPKLFTKFQRLDLEENGTVEGTGMGLAITSNLLSMMGGTISVESIYGKGSAFSVTLPQRVVSAEPLGTVRVWDGDDGKEEHGWQETFHAPEARILVVDDTRMNITVTVGLLQKTGMRIDTAQSGPEALELAKTTAYDLILMDQRMPGMDGIETLRLIRGAEEGSNRETPVICMTADAIIGAKERYTGAGFDDYLAKPVSGENLERMIARYLPPEKVTTVQRGETDRPQGESGDGDPRYAPLREAGMDVNAALDYCRQDTELLNMLLREFAGGEEERLRAIREYYSAGDWENYGILVHAAKSSSRMIGAETLSQKAAALERAAAEKDTGFIRQSQDTFEALYRETAGAARRAAGMPEDAAGPEDGVLEFAPGEK